MLINSKLGGVVYRNEDDGTNQGAGGAGDGAADVAALKAANDAKDKELASLKAKTEKYEADIKAAKNKSAEEKAAAEGRLKEHLADIQSKFEESEKSRKELLAKFDAIDKDKRKKADEAFAKLPKEKQEELAIVRDALDTDRWVALVGKAQANMAADETPPHVGQGDGRKTDPKKRYKPQHARVISERLGVDPDMPWLSQMEVVESAGTRGFQLPVSEFIKKLKERRLVGTKVNDKK